ncbi:MAG TPA: tetratricopeptide repeat protein [Gemmataceae bacterium]|nr:tetratricopeptide repeat protein [Gemmataceae bacterium]
MARIVPDPSAKPAARPQAAAAAPAQRPPGRAGGYILLVLCLLQFGLISGWAVSHYYPQSLAALGLGEPPPTSEKKEDPETLSPLKPGEAPTVERGDDLMREGRYDLALKIYHPLAVTASGALRDALQYRVGLCQEGLGRADEALQAYQKVSRTENLRSRAAAEIGQARVLIRQRKAAEAKDLLYPLLLRSGTPGLRDQACLGDARYLLALTLTLEALKPEKPGPLSDALADYTAADWPVEAALDWVGAVKEGKGEKSARAGDTARDEKDANYVGVERTGPDSMRVSAAVSQGTLMPLIERMAERARLKVEWTDSAKKVAAERGAAVAWQDLPVGDVLIDLILPLADPLGLVATIKDGTLRLATEAETAPAAVTAYRTTTATRALNNAVTSDPGHRLTAAAYLELGNLEARAGELKEASGRYERLVHEFRRSPLVVEASYNLGMVRLKEGQTPAARTAFYAARDHAPGHELAPLALLQIGRTFLLEGDPDQAIKPLKDALAVSAGTPTEAGAALTLAAAYLLADKPQAHEASQTVRRHREALAPPPYRATALFLDAYGQLLEVKGKGSAREATELLATLWAVEQKEPVLGPVGPLLIGHAYRDLDQPDEMIAVYQKALSGIKGPVAAEMSYAVAQDLSEHNKLEAARKLYLPLSKMEGSRWAASAQLRLAEIALQTRRPQETLQLCRKLLADKQAPQRDVLLLMGRAYEEAGEPRKAASCFKGEVPE